ncbi:MAG: glutaredoxin family protein [Spirochaetaceae bacterium]|nr:MAG: glutaredoxin family protein [Spirochaetaceae bacterium]
MGHTMSNHISHEVFEGIDFDEHRGSDSGHDVTVYSLSTCAFCRKAIDFLDSLGVSFRVLELDTIPKERKREIKRYLKERFEDLPVFPILIVDDSECLSGFAEDAWRKKVQD